MAGNQKVATENINEVILRLLKLNSGVEIDYQTYYTIIKKKLASARLIGKEIPREEDELLREEFKRVKNKTGRFKVKTSKVKVTPPPSAGPERGGGGEMPPRSQGSIVKSKSGKITADNFFFQNFIDPVKIRDITEKSAKISEASSDYLEILKSSLERINKNLDSIVDTLTNINKQNKDRLEESRKEEEDRKRKSREGELESKTFDGIKKAISVVTKPFQSIWDKILNFIKNIILGRILIKLVNWIADPKNQGKIKSIIRFFKDWWPALLGSYVLFGTTFGKFVRGTVGMLGRFIFQIGKVAIPQLLKFIRTPLGKGIALFTAGATIPAMFPGTVNEQERKTSNQPGSSQDKIKSLQQQKANLNIFERLQGKGSEIDEQIYYLQTGKTKSYGFNGGGFSGGIISGPKGRDRVPAMLTDGEFVMSVGAVNKYGVETLEAMNAAGGGTNEPKVVGNTTYAYGGGFIGSKDPLKNIKDFIKHKIGYDVDKPGTWGKSFMSAFNNGTSMKTNNYSGSNKGFDFNSIQNNYQGLANQAQGRIRSALDPRSYQNLANQVQGQIRSSLDPRSYQGLANQAQGQIRSALDPRSYQGLVNQAQGQIRSALDPRSYQGLANQAQGQIRSALDPRNYQGLVNQGKKLIEVPQNALTGVKNKALSILDMPLASLERYGTNRENALIKSGELLPGESLTKTSQKRLKDRDEYVKNLYNPEKDKGILGFTKMAFQDVQNKGLIPDIFASLGLKEERTEKLVEKLTKGKVKNLGAKITGLQYAIKGLAGPLGSAFRIDDRGSLGRYVKPAMLEAQRRGQGGVGAVGLGQKDYNRLMGDRLANLALGQFSFKVDKSGRAKTNDVYDSNKSSSEYFKKARSALKNGNIGGALFQGLSGVLRINQNTGWGNLRPGGAGIDLGGGFTPTDDKGKPIPPKKSKSPVTLYSTNDPRRKNTKQPYKSKFSRPKTANKSPVKPPPKPKVKTNKTTYKGGQRSSKANRTQKGTKPPSFSPNHSSKSTRTARSTFGVKK